jgi:CBS domain-containing protein
MPRGPASQNWKSNVCNKSAAFRRALGVGYDVIADLINGHMTLAGVATLLGVKATIWIIALTSGTSGGVLAPLFILGGALGWIEGLYLPGGSGLWAIIGMAAMMGGTMRAPLTGTLFAIELTGNVHLLVPLLVATTAAYAVTVLLLKRSILTEKISRRGQHVTREYAIDPLQLARVADVMVKDVDTLPATMPIEDAIAFFTGETKRHCSYPVVDGQRRLVAMVDRADVLRWMAEGAPEHRTLDDLLSDASAVVGHPGEIVADLVNRMVAHDVGRVPIVEPATRRVVGLVARKDLMRVRAASRRQDLERQAFFGRTVRNLREPAKRPDRAVQLTAQASTSVLSLARPCSNSPPTILSQLMNRLTSFAMRGWRPCMAQVTLVVTLVPAPFCSSTKSTMLCASNGRDMSSFSDTRDGGTESVIAMRPAPTLRLPFHS